MYATIEPRLIALLNTDPPFEPYSTSPSLELPPLHNPNVLKASGRPLLLEPDASKCDGKSTSSSQLAQHQALISGVDDDNGTAHDSKNKLGSRTLGNSSPQSLRKILGDDTGSTSTHASKKRNLVESSKEDFVQLPQPPKKQKAAKQVVPPMIIGLFEPPPQAALFPPIASSSFHDSHGRNSLNTVPQKVRRLGEKEKSEDPLTPPEQKRVSGKAPKKAVKVYKKWSEEETKNLLLGVSKHGVGCWTDILEDTSFLFNERSATDLKDRFRTCRPDAFGQKAQQARSKSQATGNGTTAQSRSSLMSENILIDEAKTDLFQDSSLPMTRQQRMHKKKLDDLAQLGIDAPFRVSTRRGRQPFTDQDDKNILLGYEIYGPAWVRIQRDTRLDLQNRNATDLRDRFRNKFPEKLASKESKGTRGASEHLSGLLEKDNAVQNQQPSTLQPSSSREGLRIDQILSSENEKETSASKEQSQSQIIGSKDNFIPFSDQSVDATDGLPFSQSFDWGNGSMAAPFTSNEMDISRLLLDESWIDTSVKEKQSFTDINSILTSSSDNLPPVPSFLNMLVSDEPMNLQSADTSFGRGDNESGD